ncbi:MAG: ferrochelatase [Chloroherpetonaceae bacterium]|nr:ferrochelatase [Chloroherpetonaceae bacterium]MCS7211522.1 ferrochelatase [Chloroherpetonaceae bacterium]MDW8019844.1 ferrochelatase [Chloroherpetonaceae bacterium]MDW8465089.1 ferrochelatase [Chloroherpetonaceae bacterium]
MKKKIGVLVTTFGEVEQLSLRTLLPNSWRILDLITSRIANLPFPLKAFIALMRSLKRKREWTKHRYRSKLSAINRAQAQALAQALQTGMQVGQTDVEFIVKDAYYFTEPYFEDVLTALHTACDGIVLLPMIPIESDFACGVGCYLTLEHLGDTAFSKVRVIKHLWNNSDFIQLSLNHLFEHWQPSTAKKVGLALVAHGTLVRDRNGEIPKFNTGYRETLAFFERLKAAIECDSRNRFSSIKLGALNHRLGGTWMPETLERALEEFKAEQIDEVVIFPFGFLADNSEADLEAILQVQAAGYPMQYVPCLNDSPDFINWLAARVRLTSTQLLDTQAFIQILSERSPAPNPAFIT